MTREGRLYVAQCLEVDVASQGESLENALANLREAVELRLEDEGTEVRGAPIIAPLEITLT